ASLPAEPRAVGEQIATDLLRNKAIMGVFDEGCMGMFNAIIPDHALHACGVFKERLSQSALYHETTQVPGEEAAAIYSWLQDRGMTFHTGPTHESDLTEAQILLQCKMYIAALRIADDFGCDAIGIQYQQGLKDLLPASDLVEGMLNNTDRPPVHSRDGQRLLHEGQPLPHFNEVDECAGLDGLLTHRIHQALGQPVENTLHDIRWGDKFDDQYVWVFLISGAAPPEHFTGGWKGAHGYRQPAMYFPNGGSTLHGISKPGEIIWSRIYIENESLHMDLGRGAAIALPEAETRRRLDATTPQWPIMHALTYGVSRDQMMAKHKANHIQVAYAHDAAAADQCLAAKAACATALGIQVNLCGTNGRS
ncbi:MAG: fucose isomerase, partial [Verrucomicrobia bacterium]|nr:fucose isomerase [Verrucomicrobiota bacterium]